MPAIPELADHPANAGLTQPFERGIRATGYVRAEGIALNTGGLHFKRGCHRPGYG